MTETEIIKLIEDMKSEASETANRYLQEVRSVNVPDWEKTIALRNYDRANEKYLVLEELLYRIGTPQETSKEF